MLTTRLAMVLALVFLASTCLSVVFFLPDLTPPSRRTSATIRTTTATTPTTLPTTSGAGQGSATGESDTGGAPAPAPHVLPPPTDGKGNGADVAKMAAVRGAMEHAWGGYVEHAWGADDLKPVSKSAANWLGGSGATVLDALSTLHIMGMDDEFARARQWVASALSFDKRGMVSTFETNIRSLGGLLSAYDLSGDAVFLDKATDLGDRLLRAFRTPSGLPNGLIELATGQGRPQSWAAGGGILSEMGTMQLEFRALSHATGDPKYADAVDHVTDVLDALPTPDGLYPLYVSLEAGTFRTTQISVGALGDSFYEYLLKQWLQTSKSEPKFKRMYDESAAGIKDHLVGRTTKSGLVYIAERNGQNLVHKMDHLVCFAGGMFALGAAESGAPSLDDPYFALGADITETCYQLYARSASGIGPETAMFSTSADVDYTVGAPYYLLRPETVESVFIMWRLTHDPKYRQWGWDIFQAIDRMCKVPTGGYSGLRNVATTARTWDDAQPSYFLAETLKYLYLLFADDSLIPLDQWVFNTEAHPLKRWVPA